MNLISSENRSHSIAGLLEKHLCFPNESVSNIIAKFPRLPSISTCTDSDIFVDDDVLAAIIAASSNDEKLKTKIPKEAIVRDAVADFYRECGEKVQTEVRLPSGVADIVTTTSVIEVKTIRGWKAAVGQAVCYSTCTGKFPEVVFYGAICEESQNLVMGHCNAMSIACSIINAKDIWYFILGAGGISETNQGLLARRLRSSLN